MNVVMIMYSMIKILTKTKSFLFMWNENGQLQKADKTVGVCE